jgi:hypothetical protein
MLGQAKSLPLKPNPSTLPFLCFAYRCPDPTKISFLCSDSTARRPSLLTRYPRNVRCHNPALNEGRGYCSVIERDRWNHRNLESRVEDSGEHDSSDRQAFDSLLQLQPSL